MPLRKEKLYNGIEADMDAPLQQPSEFPESTELSPADRRNIIKLKRQGWSLDDIARTVKRSVTEIEIVLEMGLDDEDL